MPRRKKLTPYAPCEKPPGGGWNKPSATLPRTGAHVKYPISERFYLKTRLFSPARACPCLLSPVRTCSRLRGAARACPCLPAPVRACAGRRNKAADVPGRRYKEASAGQGCQSTGKHQRSRVTQERSKKQESTGTVRAEYGHSAAEARQRAHHAAAPTKLGDEPPDATARPPVALRQPGHTPAIASRRFRD